jgi:hypothetical protein
MRFGATTGSSSLAQATAGLSSIAARVRSEPKNLDLAHDYAQAQARYEYESTKAGMALAAQKARLAGRGLDAQILDDALSQFTSGGIKIQLPPKASTIAKLNGLRFGDTTPLSTLLKAALTQAKTVAQQASTVIASAPKITAGGPGTDALFASQSLLMNQFLISQGGGYKLVMQGDGNLVIYRQSDSKATWSSGSWRGGSDCRLVMQADGNLVIYNASSQPIWASNTNGKTTNPILVMQGNGDLGLYTGMPAWNGWIWADKSQAGEAQGYRIWASNSTTESYSDSTFAEGAVPTTYPGGAPFPDAAQPATMPVDLLAKMPGLSAEDALSLLMQTYHGKLRKDIPKDAYSIFVAWAQAVLKNRLYNQTFLRPVAPGDLSKVPDDCAHDQFIIRSDDSSFYQDYHNMMSDFTRPDVTLSCATGIQQKDWGTFGIEGFHIEKLVAGGISLVGGIVGSIIPGVGTAIGAAAGAAVGAAVQRAVGNGSTAPAQGQDQASLQNVMGQIQATQTAAGQTTQTPSSTAAQVAATSAQQAQVAQTTADLSAQVAAAVAAVKASNPAGLQVNQTTLLVGAGLAALFLLYTKKARS